MTTETYPELFSERLEDLAKVLREIIRLRDNDIGDFDNLRNIFSTGLNKEEIEDLPTGTLTASDIIIFLDADDNNVLKRTTVQDIIDLIP